MDRADYDEFVDVLNACADLTSGKRPTELAIGLCWKTLEGYSLEQIKAAISRHMRNPEVGQFMPKPADVIRQIEGASEDAAIEAWSLVEQGIRGAYAHRAQNVKFNDPIIHMVVHEMGGFSRMGMCKESEMRWVQRDFMQRYEMRSRRPLENYPGKIPTSESRCDQLPDVVLIGHNEAPALTHDAA